MAQLSNSETKRQKRKSKTEEDAPAEASQKSLKKKGRRQMVDETILGRYHQSQKLQGIIKKDQHPSNDQEDHIEKEEGENTGSEETAEPVVRVTNAELTEAGKVLEDVNKLEREKKKKLAKEKKKFKAQQKKLQKQAEEQQKESKQDKALAYMKQWKRHRDEWKFKKVYKWCVLKLSTKLTLSLLDQPHLAPQKLEALQQNTR